MKNLNDARAAKALGWKLIPVTEYRMERGLDVQPYHLREADLWVDKTGKYQGRLPDFTTNLNDTIEAVEFISNEPWSILRNIDKVYVAEMCEGEFQGESETLPALALCHALINYLKEHPHA